MTNTVQQEEQANPYNAKKEYHVEDKPFTPANQLYFEEPSEKNKLFDSDDIMKPNFLEEKLDLFTNSIDAVFSYGAYFNNSIIDDIINDICCM